MSMNMAQLRAQIHHDLSQSVEPIADFIFHCLCEPDTTAHQVEQRLWQHMLSLGKTGLQLFLDNSGDGDQGRTIHMPDGQKLKRLQEPRTRPYLTVFGEFAVTRRVYAVRESQKIQYIPLDARLQLPEQKFSYLLQDWDQSMASELPFNKVSTSLSRILGFKQSVNSLEHTGRVMSGSAAAFWDDLPMPPKDQEGQIMVTSADGKGVVMCSSALACAPKKSTTTSTSKRPGNKKMALIGSVYSVDAYVRTPEQVLEALFREQPRHQTRESPKISRPKPCHKRVRGAILRDENDKTCPQNEEIFSWIAKEIQTRDPQGVKPLVMIMDGQESLWNSGLKALPEKTYKVTEILDIIHVTSYIWEAANVFFEPKSAKARAYAYKHIRWILNSQVTKVVRALRRKARRMGLGAGQVEKINKVCGYLENHAHRMLYKDYLEQGYPIASGVIEGACRNVVKDRMEHSGMRWTMPGAHAMLALRSIQLSGLWDEFTCQRMKMENKRLYAGRLAANDENYQCLRIANLG